MTKRHIRTLAALMALALTGLMAVQVYWIDAAIHVKEERFRQDVSEAIVSVAKTLEEAESAEAVAKTLAQLREPNAAARAAKSQNLHVEQSTGRNSTPIISVQPQEHPQPTNRPNQAEISIRYIDSTGGITISGDAENIEAFLNDPNLPGKLRKLGIDEADVETTIRDISREYTRKQILKERLTRRKKSDSTSALLREKKLQERSDRREEFSFTAPMVIPPSARSNRVFSQASFSAIQGNDNFQPRTAQFSTISSTHNGNNAIFPTVSNQHNIVIRSISGNDRAIIITHDDEANYRDTIFDGFERHKNAVVEKILVRLNNELNVVTSTHGGANATLAVAVAPPAPPDWFAAGIEQDIAEKKNTPEAVAITPRTAAVPRKAEQVRVAKKVETKVAQFSDVAAKMVCELEAPRAFQQRVSCVKLDSLICKSFQYKGITAGYQYAVMLENSDSIIYAPVKNVNVPQLRAGFSTALFPNDIVPKHLLLNVFFPQERSYILESLWAMLASSGIFLAIVAGTFVFTLNSLWKQKRISDMKTDFINNMTHEFQTPIATISLATETLKGVAVSDEARRTQFIDIIYDENKRLGRHVQQILQHAAFDNGKFTVQPEELDVHQQIMTAVEHFAMQVEKKGGSINCVLSAEYPVIQADAAYIPNVIRNLLDNACKYSSSAPQIEVLTRNTQRGIILSVTDRGIGMTKEQVKRIFEKFYRVPTGNRHDVKGFGLGLNYVQTIVEAHHGAISVQSEPGVGSAFEVFLPFS